MPDDTALLLERHFETAFAAPEGVKKLRELILTLAMQGKLVPQDPTDPPASELLKEIEAEKQRLVKEKKINSSKSLPKVQHEEVPHKLPQSWAWVRLNDFGTWKSGSTPSRTNSSYYGGEIPWVKSGEVKQGRIFKADETITKEALENCSLDLNPLGSILIAMYGANIGDTGILEIEATTNQAVCACQPYSGIDNIFLSYLLLSLKQNFISQGAGAAQPNISRQKIIHTVVPLPPLPEQRRIVAKIDELMARCDELEKLRDQRDQQRIMVHRAAINRLLDTATADFGEAWQFITHHFGDLYTTKENVAELRKAILQLAVMGKLVPQDPNDPPASELLNAIKAEKQRLVKEGKIKKQKSMPEINLEEVPYDIPKGWKWVRLGEVGAFERGRSKHRPRNDKQLFFNGIYPFVQTGDVSKAKTTDNIIKTCNSYYNEFGLKQSRLWPKQTLCITIAANIAETGFLGMEACIPDSIVVFLALDEALPRFVKFFIDIAKEDLENYAPSTAQKNINLGIINELVFPLPPLPEQHRIVAKIDQLMALCDRLEATIDTATHQQTKLLHALMAGV